MPVFVSDILLKIKMIEEGIVPFSQHEYTLNEIASGLESLSPDDRIKAKRKYRKLWRKAIKEMEAAHESREKALPKRRRRERNKRRRKLENYAPYVREKKVPSGSTRRKAIIDMLSEDL